MNIQEQKRFDRNNLIFCISYFFMGLVSGVAFDVLVTFLGMASPETATSFSSFMGASTFVCSALLLLAPKLGYKKLILVGPIVAIVALLSLSFVKEQWIFPVATLAVLVGVTLFDVVLSPYLTAYTNEKNRNKIFSRTMYINVIGMTLATFFGGQLTVWRFADRLGVSTSKASEISAIAIKKMTDFQKTNFQLAQRDVLLMFVVVLFLSLIPLLFIKEKRSDYVEETVSEVSETKKAKFDWSIFANKYVLIWLVYFALIRFGASLICPYFSQFLNQELGIARGTTSTLVSLQYFAMVIFMMVSPWVVKKFGNIVSLGGLALLTIPFMFMIAKGKTFGGGMVFMVGLALFMRSGLSNCSTPVMNSLPMNFVDKNMRPAYNSVIFVAGGITSILAGVFTKEFLFKLDNGYSLAYYITMAVYTIAAILLIVVYYKKYNRLDHEVEAEESPADIDVKMEESMEVVEKVQSNNQPISACPSSKPTMNMENQDLINDEDDDL